MDIDETLNDLKRDDKGLYENFNQELMEILEKLNEDNPGGET
eukprot:CAMPEP_0116879244 /NCGR_PEP_ID=MMETSP0463-20121206/11044_1 /TAXON_ID=181622 /ORGANISM="Strombidinopsis sp, Strain SopsisLIS2011" /LENGTH=41 /DNA_ID= /DNA_START= /DNA_END= /DNA_ORIENTATION=